MDDRKCEMWLDLEGHKVCGIPATLGWMSEVGSNRLVPICDDCAARMGDGRKYLRKLPLSTDSAILNTGETNA